MSASQLLQGASWALYLLIFVLVAVRATRSPTPAHADMVLFFGDTAAIIVLGSLATAVNVVPPAWLSDLSGILLMALPYLLLRLVADFSRVPFWLVRGSELGLGLSVLAIVALPPPMPAAPALLLVAYFLALIGYDTWAFVAQARRTTGVSRRRMEAVAAGSLCVGIVLLLAGLTVAVPQGADLWMAVSEVAGLLSGIAYVAGFAPPTWLRRAWQEPEVRAFLGRAAALPYLPTTRAIVAELERAAAEATGASGATIGLLDEHAGVLDFFDTSVQHAPAPARLEDATPVDSFERTAHGWRLATSAQAVSARALRQQRPVFDQDVVRGDPANAAAYAAYKTVAALAAPITAGSHRLGVLVVYAPRAPLFANSDLELVQLLADQAAVVLESRALLDDAAAAQARAEAARLKEDFLSSAAHDLKTPIAGILTQAQVLQRRLDQHPADARVAAGVARIIGEARRLSALVLELLDVSLLDQGRLLDTRESVDLVEVAAAVCARYAASPVSCRVEAAEPIVGSLDPVRIRQLLEHLVDNAIRFSPPGAEVQIRLWREADTVRLDVADQGIGIPSEDLPRLFERFHRGSNVDDRRFAGLGLGLYLSRGIAEAHGGRIWAASTPGRETTFSVSLPVHAQPMAALATSTTASGTHPWLMT